jgi:hypothetical protein
MWFQTPYNEAWIADLKSTVPSEARSWSKDVGMWWVSITYAKRVFQLCLDHFKECFHAPQRVVPNSPADKGSMTLDDFDAIFEDAAKKDISPRALNEILRGRLGEKKNPTVDSYLGRRTENASAEPPGRSRERTKKQTRSWDKPRQPPPSPPPWGDRPKPPPRESKPPPREYDVCSSRSPLSEAYKKLQVSEGAPWELVKAAHKALVRIHHPDRGGDEEQMKSVNAAYARLQSVLDK